MKYETIPYVDKPVSRILFGTAQPSFLRGEENNAILNAALEAGITTFDTARNYAQSEKTIGTWLRARNCRDQVVILSKCAHPDEDGTKRVSEAAIRADFARSTELLGTDYIDIYVLHRDDPDVEVKVPVETLNAMHAEGKIGAFGGSNWTFERIQEANEYAYSHNLIPFTVSSPNFGLARQMKDLWGGGCVTLSGPEHEEDRAWYRKTGMPVIAYSSLGRGFFSGRFRSGDYETAREVLDSYAQKGYLYEENMERLRRAEKLAEKYSVTVPEIAMRYIFSSGMNLFAVVSTASRERLRMNLRAAEHPLSQKETEYLEGNDDE